MASYTILATSTSSNLTISNSTKIKVQSNAICYYNINAVCYASWANGSPVLNKGIIPANGIPVYINMGNIGQVFSTNTGTGNGGATLVITEIGNVYQSALNQNSTTFLNT